MYGDLLQWQLSVGERSRVNLRFCFWRTMCTLGAFTEKGWREQIQVCWWKCLVLQEPYTLGAHVAEYMPRAADRINPRRVPSSTTSTANLRGGRSPHNQVGKCSLAFKMPHIIVPMVSLPWLHLGTSFLCAKYLTGYISYQIGWVNSWYLVITVHLYCWYRWSCT